MNSQTRYLSMAGYRGLTIKRLFDIVLAVISIVILIVPMILVAVAVKLTSKGPVIYWSDRMGKNGVIFRMPKFRSLHINVPVTRSNLIPDNKAFLTPVGRFIRGFSLDELPQLFSILKGDMSWVGPRPVIPALFRDLVTFRAKHGIDQLLPGLTGWAQINGRDEITSVEKAALDAEYKKKQSFWFDIKILYITIIKVITRADIPR